MQEAPLPGPDPSALETILFACLGVDTAAQEEALAAACREHPALAEPLRRCWQRIRGLQPGSPGVSVAIAGYRILRRLGGGGMGVVYLADQERLHRKVALKLIRSDLVDSPAARLRFQREARNASKVEHPGLCPVFEVGETDGVPFLVMPFLEGMTLAARIEELAVRRRANAELSAAGRDLVAVMAAVARAAHHAHEHGLVHRDIKPGNIMLLADGRPVLLDFGLALDIASGDAALTKSSERVGTPAYMAPEQLRGEREAADRRTDVYALGIVLYEAAMLERAFVGDDLLVLREQMESGIRPASLRGRVPYDLASIVLKAADPEPARRYTTAAELAEDLERYLRLEPVTARRVGIGGRTVRWARRHPAVATLLVALLISLGFAVAALQSSRREQRHSEAMALLGESRLAERTDAVLAVEKALQADALEPTPQALVQWNRAVAARRELHRWQLDEWLCFVKFTPDHQRILAVTQKGSMLSFDVRTRGQPVRLAPPQAGLVVTFAAMAPNGGNVVFGGTGKQAWLWHLATGRCTPLAPAHEGRVLHAAIAEDGSIFTGDANGMVARWSAMGEPVGSFPWLGLSGPALELLCVGPKLVVGGRDLLVLAPLAGDEPVLRVPVANLGSPGEVQNVMLLSGAATTRRFFAAQLGRHGVFDLEGERSRLPGPALRWFGGQLNPQGTRLAVAHRGFVRVYDLMQDLGPRRPPERTLGLDHVDRANYRDTRIGEGPVGWTRFSADGSRLFAAAEDNVLQVLDGDGEPLLSLPGFAKPVRSVDLDPATQVLVTGDEAGAVRLWDVRLCRPMPPEFKVTAGVFNGFATDSNDPLVVRRDNGRLVAFPVDGSEPWSIEAGERILQDARVSPDGSLLALAARGGLTSVWDLVARERTWVLPPSPGTQPIAVDFLPGNRLLVVVRSDPRQADEPRPGEVQVWRIGQEGDEPEAKFVGGANWGRLNHGAATRDGRHVVIGSFENKAWVIPLSLEAPTPTFGEPLQIEVGWTVVHIDVARQGGRFVAVCADDSARVFRLDGALEHHLVGHEKRVERAHFSSTGRWIVTASQEGTARIWDSNTGQSCMEVVVGGPSPVWDALFREDEKILYTVSLDGLVRGWLLDRELLRALPTATVRR